MYHKIYYVNIIAYYTGPMEYLLYKELVQKFNDSMKMEVVVLSAYWPMTEDTNPNQRFRYKTRG